MPIVSYTIPSTPAVVPVVSPGGGAGTLLEITDICTESLSLLLAEYQDSPRVKDLICSYLKEVQDLETATVAVYANVLSLDTAVGVQLDLLGRLVQEARDGRTDTDYRRALRVRVLINISDGKIEELIAIARLYEDMDSTPGSAVRIQELQPAKMEIRVITPPVNPRVEVDKRLRLAKAAGVTLHTMIHYGGVAGNFTFIRAADYPEKNTTQGFEGIAGPVAGGDFSSVLE